MVDVAGGGVDALGKPTGMPEQAWVSDQPPEGTTQKARPHPFYHMHPSYFLNIGLSEDNPMRELKLPAEISEWLFYADYWGRVNDAAGTSFSQYEEEMLVHQHMPRAMEGLEKIKEVLLKMTTSDIRFIYGWNEGRGALYCAVSVKALIQNIEGLEKFFLSAFDAGADVYCQL